MVGATVSDLVMSPSGRTPSSEHREAVRRGQEFMIADVVITGATACRRFISFRSASELILTPPAHTHTNTCRTEPE